MDIFLQAMWAMFTNNGMYSTTETIVMLIVGTIGAVLFMGFIFRKAENERTADMISDIGYAGYLRHKEHTLK